MTRRAETGNLQGMITNSLDAAVAERRQRDAEGAAIEVRALRKAYGPTQALDGVDLTVRRGELLAVLGPNGAGKTTLVEILEGHRSATSGEVSVLGFDPADRERDFRRRIGIVTQEEGLDPLLTVAEAVDLYAAAYPDPRPTAEVLELVGLGERADVRTQALSGGQRRRLELALAIAGNPELIFLDEPTTGFDPAARRQSWELIASLREHGTTILLTTHYLDEAQHLADRVVVVAGGRVIAEGTPESLGAGGEPRAQVAFKRPEASGGEPLPLPADVATERDGRIAFTTPAPTRDLAPIIAWAAARGVELEGLTVTRPTLEDVYLELTQEAKA
jgi:ABC-2 type transport system ATP-binding protein